MKKFYLLMFLVGLVELTLQAGTSLDHTASPVQVPPNILLIMSDDQGWGDLHIHGNEDIYTPFLDALGRESVRFDQFFVSPVGAPTRASLLTDRDYLRTNTHVVTGQGVAMRSGEKGSVDEGSVRVPCFIRYPDVLPSDSTVTQNAAHLDLLPTLLELAGIPVPDTLSLDGKSLLPLLQGIQADWPQRNLFTHYSGKELTPRPGGVRTEQYRLVMARNGETHLYDMKQDPGQKNDIASQQPGLVNSLLQDYQVWYKEVTKNLEKLPIPVGYPQAPVTTLPAHEATLKGNLRYQFENGYTNDWITNWTHTGDSITWPLQVVTAGEYNLLMEYACDSESTGAVIRAEIAQQTIEKKIVVPHPLQIIEAPNHTPPGNPVDVQWKKVHLGKVKLETGQHSLLLQGVRVSGKEIAQLKSIIMLME